jgi:hypothetical protein
LKRRTFYLSLTAIIIALFFILAAADTINGYRNYTGFPQRQSDFIRSFVNSNTAPRCVPSASNDSNVDSEILNLCFFHSTQTSSMVLKENTEDEDQLYLEYGCEYKKIAARFQFVIGRTDPHFWCQYKTGPELQYIRPFDIHESAIMSGPPNLLLKAVLKVFNRGSEPR